MADLFCSVGRAVMSIATHRDLQTRPVAPDAANDEFEDTGRLFSGGLFTGAQER